MYASVSTSHWPLAAEPHIDVHINGGNQEDAVSISCHLSHTLYVSFQPDEASEAQRRIDAAMGRVEATF